MKNEGGPKALLLLFVLGSYGWQHVPADAQADIASIGAHAIILALLLMVGRAYRSRSLLPVLILQAGYSLQAAGCSAAYLIAPWPVQPGEEQCSAGLGIPLGMFGLVAALLILSNLSRRRDGHLNR